MSISTLGGRQARGLEDLGNINVLFLKLCGGNMSVHFITIPYCLHIDVINYFVHIKYSLIYKF